MNKVTFPEAEKPGSMSVLPNSFGYSSGGPRVPRKGCQGPEGTKSGFAERRCGVAFPQLPPQCPHSAPHPTTPGAPTRSPAPGRVSLYYLGGRKGNLE